MILVVWMTRDERDHFEAYEDREQAWKRYVELLETDDLHSASVAAVLNSTDYEAAII